MNRPPRTVSLFAGAFALLFGPDCSSATNTSELRTNTTEHPPGVTLTAATWTRAWDLSAVTPEPDGGFSVDTNLGYRVRVTEGWLVHHSISLTPCDPPENGAEEANLGDFPFAIAIKSAFAHDEAKDPSAIEALRIEDLTNLDDAELGASSFPPAVYCRAHWLVARPTGEQIEPESVSMGGSSVRLAGSWSRGGDSGAFSIDTWWPQAILIDIEDAAIPDDLEQAKRDGASRFAFITIRRPLGRAFDGIDFGSSDVTEDQIAGFFLDNVVAGADLSVELWSPSAE